MAKAKTTAFFCKECGYESSKWMGQCPACKAWNSMVEEPVSKSAGSQGGLGRLSSGSQKSPIPAAKPSLLSEIDIEEQDRISTGFGELDRVLGDGIVAGSLVLVGGDPGIGKSTLLLQVCRNLAGAGQRVLYISGEESLKQIKMRANRIGPVTGELKFLCETSLEHIERAIDTENPQIAVIDSIQTMYREEISSAPGSVSQVRESTGILMQIAKSRGIAIFVVGHVTKEGVVAGPRVLEHMVDTVLYFEGDRHASYRILRSVKNRFGSTNEIGVFEMQECGLVEVKNPSQVMLNGRPTDASGTVVVCSLEGTRPILIEIQALVTKTNFGLPRRTSVGIDYNRVNLLMAVLEKRAGLALGNCDAYVNLAGGMKLGEPAIDLGIVAAIISSYRNRTVDPDTLIFGEVGLSGEVRGVSQAQQRVKEAEKMGFTTCIMPKANLEGLQGDFKIALIGVGNIKEVMGYI